MKEKLTEAAAATISAATAATFLPVATLFGGVYFMVLGHGNINQTWEAVKTLQGGQLFALGALVLVLALVLQPFQSILTAAVFRLSGSRRLSMPRLRRHGQLHAAAKRLAMGKSCGRPWWDLTARSFQRGSFSVLYPPSDDDILPTALGNALASAHKRSGNRYRFEFDILGPSFETFLADNGHRLIASRFADVELHCAQVAVFVLLIPLAPITMGAQLKTVETALVCLSGALASYASSVAAAVRYGKAIATSLDLYRFDFLRALRIALPVDHASEGLAFQRAENLAMGFLPPDDDTTYAHVAGATSLARPEEPAQQPDGSASYIS
jgi:hypothetical protein